MKSVLWGVTVRLSYISDTWYLKVKDDKNAALPCTPSVSHEFLVTSI
jgi:hypothetical protein